MAQSFHLRAI